MTALLDPCLRRLSTLRGDAGQGVVEYALILASVAVLAAGAFLPLGDALNDRFSDVLSWFG